MNLDPILAGLDLAAAVVTLVALTATAVILAWEGTLEAIRRIRSRPARRRTAYISQLRRILQDFEDEPIE